MNKTTKKALVGIAAFSMCAAIAIAASGCGSKYDYDGSEIQGVKVENGVVTFTVGNTAATSGVSASVGVPFNYGLQAWLWSYEQAHPNVKFDFKHYDDTFDGAKGLQYTQQLVETDKVFALVGHFGTPTIEATVDYISETGVPMVYAATGVSSLYNTNAKGYERAIMSVQPIYNTEGRSMVATAVAPAPTGLAGTNIGCIYTTDDAGNSIYNGVKEEAGNLKITVKAQAVDANATDYSSAVNALKSNGCDVVIIASAQPAFSKVATQFVASNYDNVKIITSYVSANGTTMGALAEAGVTTATRKLYSGAWLDIIDKTGNAALYGFSDEYWAFAALMSSYATDGPGGAENAALYGANSYAMAGYVAGYTFTQGIDRLMKDKTEFTKNDFTWLKYVEAMESEPVTVALTQGASINLANGSRLGVTSLSLTEYTSENAAAGGVVIRPLTALEAIETAYKNR